MPRQVADIEVEEIHLVDSPANKRKFLLMKSDGSADDADVALLEETEEEKEARLKLEAEALAAQEVADQKAKEVADAKAVVDAEAANEEEARLAAQVDALAGPSSPAKSPELEAALATISPEAAAEVEAALSKAHLSPEAERARRIVIADMLGQMRNRIDDIFEMLTKRQTAENEVAAAAVIAAKTKADAEEALSKSENEEVPASAVAALESIAASIPDEDTLKDMVRAVRAHAHA